MAELTKDIDRQIKSIAFKLSSNYDDRQDAIQEGRIRVLEMPSGDTSAYYVTAARYAMRDYLKKTRLNRGETDKRRIEPIDELFESTFSADDFEKSRAFSGNDTTINKGKKRITLYDYDTQDYGANISDNDRINQAWLNGYDYSVGT